MKLVVVFLSLALIAGSCTGTGSNRAGPDTTERQTDTTEQSPGTDPPNDVPRTDTDPGDPDPDTTPVKDPDDPQPAEDPEESETDAESEVSLVGVPRPGELFEVSHPVPGVELFVEATSNLFPGDVAVTPLLDRSNGAMVAPVVDFTVAEGAEDVRWATVTFTYNDSGLSAADEEALRVVTFDEETSAWEPVGGASAQDIDANTIRADLEHFSVYSVAGGPVPDHTPYGPSRLVESGWRTPRGVLIQPDVYGRDEPVIERRSFFRSLDGERVAASEAFTEKPITFDADGCVSNCAELEAAGIADETSMEELVARQGVFFRLEENMFHTDFVEQQVTVHCVRASYPQAACSRRASLLPYQDFLPNDMDLIEQIGTEGATVPLHLRRLRPTKTDVEVEIELQRQFGLAEYHERLTKLAHRGVTPERARALPELRERYWELLDVFDGQAPGVPLHERKLTMSALAEFADSGRASDSAAETARWFVENDGRLGTLFEPFEIPVLHNKDFGDEAADLHYPLVVFDTFKNDPDRAVRLLRRFPLAATTEAQIAAETRTTMLVPVDWEEYLAAPLVALFETAVQADEARRSREMQSELVARIPETREADTLFESLTEGGVVRRVRGTGLIRNDLIVALYVEHSQAIQKWIGGASTANTWGLFGAWAADSVRPAIAYPPFGMGVIGGRHAAAGGNQWIFDDLGIRFGAMLDVLEETPEPTAIEWEEFLTDPKVFGPGDELARLAFITLIAAAHQTDPKEKQRLIFQSNALFGLQEQSGVQRYLEAIYSVADPLPDPADDSLSSLVLSSDGFRLDRLATERDLDHAFTMFFLKVQMGAFDLNVFDGLYDADGRPLNKPVDGPRSEGQIIDAYPHDGTLKHLLWDRPLTALEPADYDPAQFSTDSRFSIRHKDARRHSGAGTITVRPDLGINSEWDNLTRSWADFTDFNPEGPLPGSSDSLISDMLRTVDVAGRYLRPDETLRLGPDPTSAAVWDNWRDRMWYILNLFWLLHVDPSIRRPPPNSDLDSDRLSSRYTARTRRALSIDRITPFDPTNIDPLLSTDCDHPRIVCFGAPAPIPGPEHERGTPERLRGETRFTTLEMDIPAGMVALVALPRLPSTERLDVTLNDGAFELVARPTADHDEVVFAAGKATYDRLYGFYGMEDAEFIRVPWSQYVYPYEQHPTPTKVLVRVYPAPTARTLTLTAEYGVLFVATIDTDTKANGSGLTPEHSHPVCGPERHIAFQYGPRYYLIDPEQPTNVTITGRAELWQRRAEVFADSGYQSRPDDRNSIKIEADPGGRTTYEGWSEDWLATVEFRVDRPTIIKVSPGAYPASHNIEFEFASPMKCRDN